MIELFLNEDTVVLLDAADRLLVAGFDWRAMRTSPYLTYAHAWNRQQSIYMHRLIAGAGKGEEVDHIDRNGLNNTRYNLRIATHQQNHANRTRERKAHRTSQYKGVYWDKSRDKWSATIHVNGKTRALGRYEDEGEAARAYDKAAVSEWHEFARINFPVVTGYVTLEELLAT